MPQPRVIVGVGALVLAEYGDLESPAGLAASVPLWARRLGQRGVSLSRLGQDAAAARLTTELHNAGVDVRHLQSDPDWPTGRLRVRSGVAGRGAATLDPDAAFDHLQWDFDMVDVAQEADVVVFGRLGRRRGQAASAIQQFLGSCRAALRIFDLTEPPVSQPLEREHALAAMEFTDAVVADPAALHTMTPSVPSSAPVEAAARELIRLAKLRFVLLIEPGRGLSLITAAETHSAPCAEAWSAHPGALVALVHGQLSGWDDKASLQLAVRVASFGAAHPTAPVPAQLLERP